MKTVLIILFTSISVGCAAQVTDSLSLLLDKEVDMKPIVKEKHVTVFKGTQLVNSRTTETLKKYQLDFRIGHKFGDLGGEFGGEKSFFGLENSTDVKIGFDYGLTNRLTIGIGRAKGATSVRQLYEGGLKYKLLQQATNGSMPFTLTFFGNAVISSMSSNVKANTPDHFSSTGDRMSYTGQLLIGRKFSELFSLMLVPTYVHTNYVVFNDQNDILAAGIGGRLKLSKHFGIVADYFKVFRGKTSTDRFKASGIKFYDPLGVGIEIETGGHVFDFNFTNSTALLENQFIPYTTSSWNGWHFRWAFNMSRIFSLKKNKK